MSINRERPHVFVLPEDDANRQVALGFGLYAATGQLQVLRVAKGWRKVVEAFNASHASGMRRLPLQHMVLLVDFDGDENRRTQVRQNIPSDLAARVYILGCLKEPEDLRRSLGSYETIGQSLAQDCRHDTNSTWNHALLIHNAGELDRLRTRVRPILFP